MKSAVSPYALEIDRALSQKNASGKVAETEISSNLRATFWFPDISIDHESCCQYFGCQKVFRLEEGFTYPLPIARMVDGELFIRNSPMLIFCSLQHLFDATVPSGAVVTKEGRVYSLVRH